MKKTFLALVAALLMSVGLMVAVPSPAQAFGWSPYKCDPQEGNYANVCVAVHSIPFQNGLRVDQVSLCAAHYSDPGNHFRGTKTSTILFNQGGVSLVEAPADECRYTNYNSPKNGVNACYHAQGILDIAGYPDQPWDIGPFKILGGAC